MAWNCHSGRERGGSIERSSISAKSGRVGVSGIHELKGLSSQVGDGGKELTTLIKTKSLMVAILIGIGCLVWFGLVCLPLIGDC